MFIQENKLSAKEKENMIKSFICVLLALVQLAFPGFLPSFRTQTTMVNTLMKYQTSEGFGTSSAWWSQTISDEDTAREIARLLYDKETGLGLDIYRYNIGGGEAENPDCRIWDRTRRTESFYVFDESEGKWKYDFTRDANAVRMMKLAVEYGASEVVLFCNSPHYSMTASGHASGGLNKAESNLPRENYPDFVDYVLTVADHFVEMGIPVKYVSPVNEPQWDWGGEWVGQEGCHYTPDECIELLELFAVTMQERNCPYGLSGPESGQLTWDHYEYLEKFMNSEILRNYCDHFAGHSYWMDDNFDGKKAFGEKMEEEYPDMKFEMTEWCELPLKIDSTTVDSGIRMANTIIQDLTLMNAASWSSWTAVNGDGLMEIKDGNLEIYNRYYAYMHFSKFIESGMKRIKLTDVAKSTDVAKVAYHGNGKTVIVLVNNSEEEQELSFAWAPGKYEIYLTDKSHNCEKTAEGLLFSGCVIPGRSIETIVIGG